MKTKKVLLVAVAALLFSSAFAAKPVGVWKGLAWQRLHELLNVTVFSPQWHKDKPLTTAFTGKEFDKVSSVVYIHGFNQIFRFREWKKDMVEKMENFVSNGGVLFVLIDGAPRPPSVTKVGMMSKLLGATKYTDITDDIKIQDESWADCGRIPEVFKHMLNPKITQGAKAKPLIALTGFTTAKPIIGDGKSATVAVNQLGKGKVYFVNVRLTESVTSYKQPRNYVINADLEQYWPFAKKIHAALLEAQPALSKEKREIWEPIPLGPKAQKTAFTPRTPVALVSARKVKKIEGAPLPLVVDGKPRALLITGGTGATGTPGAYDILNNLLKKMSGTVLPMPNPKAVREKNGKWYWKGKPYDTKVVFKAADHVSVVASGNLITIGTPARDPALGIYTFMRECLGYRMLWPGDDGEVYTKNATVKIDPIDLYDKSPMKYRHFRNSLVCGKYDWKTPEGKVIKVNARPGLSQACDIMGIDVPEAIKLRKLHTSWAKPQRLGGTLFEAGGGNFYSWGKRFGKTHPEYLALQFETFRKVKDRHPRICKSNPEVIKQAVKDVLKNVKATTEYCRFSPSDGGYDLMCMCENCRKWDCSDAPRGATRVYLGRNRPVYRYVSMTDRVLRFTIEAAKELRKHNPKLGVVYMPYSSYFNPPNYHHDIPDNMLINFVGGDFINIKGRQNDIKCWNYWSSMAKNLCWRPNFLGHDSKGGFPLIYVSALAKDLKYFASTGMVGGDFDTLPHNYATEGLNYYVLAQLMWDPAAKVEDIIDDFCKSGFGAGAEEMKNFYKHCEKLTDVFALRNESSVKEFEDLTVARNLSGNKKLVAIFNDKEMDKLEGFLKAARSKVAADSPEARRIEFVAAGLEYCRKNSAFWKKFWNAKTKADRQKLIPEIDALVDYWKKLFREKPFAISVPAEVYGHYTSFFRYCNWKPVRPFKK